MEQLVWKWMWDQNSRTGSVDQTQEQEDEVKEVIV